MNILDRFTDRLVDWLKWLGSAALASMMAVTCLDVICRAVDRPLWGLVETVSILATLVLAAAMPTTQRERGHVVLDMLVRRLPARASAGVDAAGHLVSLLLFAAVAWQCWTYASELQANGELTMSLGLPLHLILRLIALAFGVLCLTLMADVQSALGRVVRP